MIAVASGDGIKDAFKELGVDLIIDGGQTMNPSTEAFVKAVESFKCRTCNYLTKQQEYYFICRTNIRFMSRL